MAHQIDMTNGRANMAYVGTTPWHGLGQNIDPDSTIDQWKIAAGLDWHIQKRPIFYGTTDDAGNKLPRVIADRFAHVRSDNQENLGIGSDKFQLMQPGDTLEFYRDLVEDSRFTVETAGALNGGAKIWALARCDINLTINGKDVITPYLLIATANDGSMSTVADFTSIRVVCNNTLSLAVGHNGGKASIRVPHSSKFDADQVKADLGLIDDRLETFAIDADLLASRKVSRDEALAYFVDLYAKKDDDGKITNERTLKTVVNDLQRTFVRGPGADLDSANGTAWGLVNAVTNYVDYNTRARSDENRFISGQFGNGANVKSAAFTQALALTA